MPPFLSLFSPTQKAVAAGFPENWVTIYSNIVQTEFAIFINSSISHSLKYISYAFLTKLSNLGLIHSSLRCTDKVSTVNRYGLRLRLKSRK